jgi:hypothetical protein
VVNENFILLKDDSVTVDPTNAAADLIEETFTKLKSRVVRRKLDFETKFIPIKKTLNLPTTHPVFQRLH